MTQTRIWVCTFDRVSVRLTPVATEGVSYRVAGNGEAGDIASLHADSWRSAYRGLLPDEYLDHDVGEERARVWANRFREREGTLTIVAERQGVLVGFAHTVLDEDPDWGSLIDNLHVSPNAKRGGIGRGLLHETATQLRVPSPGRIHLWVLEANAPARAFYTAIGGTESGAGSTDDGGADLPTLRFAWETMDDLHRGTA